MAFKVQCANCHCSLKIKDELAGRRGKCPACGEKIILKPGDPDTTAEEVEDAIPVAEIFADAAVVDNDFMDPGQPQKRRLTDV